MAVKKVMAMIVAALVAGVVLGGFGVADAATKTAKPAPAAMNCATCPDKAAGCPKTADPAAAPKAGCPSGAKGSGGMACGSCE